MRLALRELPGAPRMVEVDGHHRYTDGERWWPSATELVSRMHPYHGPEWSGPPRDSPAAVGARVHQAMEARVRGEAAPDTDPATGAHVRHLSSYLDRVGDVYAVEQPVLSRNLNVAGTVDLVCDYDGELTVIDWKTKRRQPDYATLKWHFVQAAIYAQCWREMAGDGPQQLMVIVSTGSESMPHAIPTVQVNEDLYSDAVMRALHELNSEMAQ